MKDEIKEKIKAYYIGNDIDKVLDCITNLQEENEIIHKDFNELSEKYFFEKSRNEKAIECIKILGIDKDTPDKDLLIRQVLKTLLNILQGEDKDD